MEVDKAISQAFTPEFLGRLDAVVQFAPLPNGAMEAIARKYLHQLQQRTEAMGSQLLIPENLVVHLASKGSGADGARKLRRVVQQEVEGPLASFLLRCNRKPGKIRLSLEGDRIMVNS